MIVENLAFDKIVGIWGHDPITGQWEFVPCTYSGPLPENLELWKMQAGPGMDQFDVEYNALGQVYWDSNGGYNYSLNAAYWYQGGSGTNVAVIGPNIYVSGYGGALNVTIWVKNLAYAKQVGILFTTDNWATYQTAFTTYGRALGPGAPHQIQTEEWVLDASIVPGVGDQFAAFYTLGGVTYWDNNFGSNYSF